MQQTAKDIDSYIEQQPENVRHILTELRQTIKKAVPEAEELISYQMPAFRLNKILVWFAVFKKHYTVFVPGNVLKEYNDQLKSYEMVRSGAGVKIPLEEPVPVQLIENIIKSRAKEILKK